MTFGRDLKSGNAAKIASGREVGDASKFVTDLLRGDDGVDRHAPCDGNDPMLVTDAVGGNEERFGNDQEFGNAVVFVHESQCGNVSSVVSDWQNGNVRARGDAIWRGNATVCARSMNW